MRASLKVAGIGGLVALLGFLGSDAGSQPGGAGGQPQTVASAAAPAAPVPSAPLSVADAAAAKADPDCQAADVACAWDHCNPLGKQWASYHACIADSCKVADRVCMGDLIMDLNDPARQKTGGRR
jgi:hypothetical protein